MTVESQVDLAPYVTGDLAPYITGWLISCVHGGNLTAVSNLRSSGPIPRG